LVVIYSIGYDYYEEGVTHVSVCVCVRWFEEVMKSFH
jgi:hypothetical protein